MGDSDQFKARTMKRKNVKGLALSAPAPKPTAPQPSQPDAMLPGSLANSNSNRDDTLEIGVEFRPDWRTEDLEVIKDLGAGNGGTVSKVRHTGWNIIMARKIIHVEAKKEVRKRIVRELQIMHECNSPYIVNFYGAFMNESGDVTMCMEYADVGSLDSISKNFGPVRVDVLGKIAEAILGGLKYLYLAHRIMHRDIKPSNVLVNSRGQIKLCDFGVSSELENSVADTFVGTGTYMAPERIQGSSYTVKSDVWSVGLTLMELAIGKFPFSVESEDDDGEEAGGPQGILDLLQQIVLEPSPQLPKSDAFPQILEDFIDKCLQKDPKDRPTPQQLYDEDAFLQAAKRTPVDLEAWAVGLMEKHNRKSHLAPQLSPGTKALLRGEDTPAATPVTARTVRSAESGSTSGTASTLPTPTSGDIYISSQSNGSSRTPGLMQPPMSGRSQNSDAYSSRYAAPEDIRPQFPTRTSSAQQVPSYGAERERSERYDSSRGPDSSRGFDGSRGGYDGARSARDAPAGGYPMQLPIRQAPPSSRGGVRDGRPDTAGSDRSDGYRSTKPVRQGYVQ